MVQQIDMTAVRARTALTVVPMPLELRWLELLVASGDAADWRDLLREHLDTITGRHKAGA